MLERVKVPRREGGLRKSGYREAVVGACIWLGSQANVNVAIEDDTAGWEAARGTRLISIM